MKNEHAKTVSDYHTLEKRFSNLNDVFIEYRTSSSQERLNNILEHNKVPFTNEGLGYKTETGSSMYSKNLVSSQTKKTVKICFFCHMPGHIVRNCKAKKALGSNSNVPRNQRYLWVRKGTKPDPSRTHYHMST